MKDGSDGGGEQEQPDRQRRSAAAAVICGACGAKIKAGRRNCLRCGVSLDATPAGGAGAEPALASRPGPALIAGSLISSLILLIFVGAFVGRSGRPATTVSPPDEAAALEAAADVPVPPVSAIDDTQTNAAGTVAYHDGDYSTAEQRYRQVLDVRPDDADALNNLGQVLVRTGKADEALPYFDRAIELYPAVWAYRFNRARAYGELEDWDRAIPEYRQAVALFPDDYATQFNLANALHKQGNEAEAVVEFEKAIALAPSEPTFYRSIAVSYEKLNRIDEAVEAYGLYVEKAPDAPDAQAVMDHIESLTGKPYARDDGRDASISG